MSDSCAANEPASNKDEVIAKLEHECDMLRAALAGARRELSLSQSSRAAAARREKYDQHMGWHPDFDPHDLSGVTIFVDPDCGRQIALPCSALDSVFARRVFRKLRVQLRCLSTPADISARRELIAGAYQKIASMRGAPRWRQLLVSFLAAAKIL